MNSKKILLIVGGGALACLCLCIVIAAVAFISGSALTQPAADVGEKFMQALKDANYDAAFATFHPALQKELGNAQGLRRATESGKARPSKWNFTSRNINNNDGTLEGTVTMVGGEGTVTIELVKTGDAWKIIRFDLQAK